MGHPETDVSLLAVSTSLLPHKRHDDLPFLQMCSYRYYEGCGVRKTAAQRTAEELLHDRSLVFVFLLVLVAALHMHARQHRMPARTRFLGSEVGVKRGVSRILRHLFIATSSVSAQDGGHSRQCHLHLRSSERERGASKTKARREQSPHQALASWLQATCGNKHAGGDTANGEQRSFVCTDGSPTRPHASAHYRKGPPVQRQIGGPMPSRLRIWKPSPPLPQPPPPPHQQRAGGGLSSLLNAPPPLHIDLLSALRWFHSTHHQPLFPALHAQSACAYLR
ncbi:hypothetical protein ABL78_7548 [Leptomonas seymouri]|uniref:Uncharacterized protein n=1 Tax=Leptomonas seymouri TaxID=5684 RepID=A0A0N1HZE3_LEPSE|nr:hypothetical protein ABL78_7548 [Leptomonas seymouri]|eukprot:KPI83421.1 hypothetical protein ABL78_7548 [Leptomonas seymouri]